MRISLIPGLDNGWGGGYGFDSGAKYVVTDWLLYNANGRYYGRQPSANRKYIVLLRESS